MKMRDHRADLRTKSIAELTKLVQEKEKGLLDHRFANAFGKLSNIQEIRKTRKEIARIKTLIREKITEQYKETTAKES